MSKMFAASCLNETSHDDDAARLTTSLPTSTGCAYLSASSTSCAYQCVQGSAPSYLQNAICPVASAESRRRLRSASSADLIVPATRRRPTTNQQWAQDRAFAVAAPRAWNSLPDAIRRSPSPAVFKRSLKTHFYIQSFH